MAQFPQSTSQQSAVLGLLEPEVVSSYLTALDGFLSSCLLLPLACIYVKEQPQKAVVVSPYTPGETENRSQPPKLECFQIFHFQFPL